MVEDDQGAEPGKGPGVTDRAAMNCPNRGVLFGGNLDPVSQGRAPEPRRRLTESADDAARLLFTMSGLAGAGTAI